MTKPKYVASLLAVGLSSSVPAQDSAGVGTGAEIVAEPASPHSFTANVALASEYIYRGIGQTNRKPAIQGGFDYSHSSGFYLGTWASSISWLSDQPGDISSNVEIDFYGGFKAPAGPLTFDAGVLQYYYPGSYPSGFTRPYTTELYVAATWRWLTAKYSYALTNLFGTKTPSGGDTDGSGYLELNGSVELGEGFSLQGHVGHQRVRNYGDASYTDWKFGVSKDFKVFVVNLSYVDTNAKGGEGEFYRNAHNRDLGAGRALLMVSRTF